jgi:hypothetical protein
VALSGTLALSGALSACGSATSRAAAAPQRSSTARNVRTEKAQGQRRSGHHAATSTTSAPGTTPTSGTAAPTTLPTAAPGWTVVAETSSGVVTDTRTLHLPDGDQVTLVRWHAGTYRIDLHFGSEDPPSSGLSIPAVAGDAISAAERPVLLGAFNGGFYTSTGSGGFEADGIVAKPLVPGDASIVVDSAGQVQIGEWDRTVPIPGTHVVSVRQNLQPLVSDGVASPVIDDIAAWGATLGGGAVVARSAVGVDAAGDLVYAGSMAALPADLADALISVGVKQAMQLDINPYWVQADVSSSPGSPLRAAIPGQQRPADTYLLGWTRDFFAVLARR